jgi:hypothetical protein
MGYKAIAEAARALAALTLIVSMGVAASGAVAQSASGMGMLDLEVARDSFFSSADADGDLALSSDEQLSAMGASSSQLFECWDGDGDGVCTYTEYMDSAERVFEELDLDRNGQLTASEVQ